jgi:hypothetical protein
MILEGVKEEGVKMPFTGNAGDALLWGFEAERIG